MKTNTKKNFDKKKTLLPPKRKHKIPCEKNTQNPKRRQIQNTFSQKKTLKQNKKTFAKNKNAKTHCSKKNTKTMAKIPKPTAKKKKKQKTHCKKKRNLEKNCSKKH